MGSSLKDGTRAIGVDRFGQAREVKWNANRQMWEGSITCGEAEGRFMMPNDGFKDVRILTREGRA